ncbi:MAG: hypothetical protein ACR2F1_07105 [Nitrososphaeraceae archaeon]
MTPQTEVYILMDLCIESYKTKGKFLPEMKKDEVKQTMKEFEESEFRLIIEEKKYNTI